MILSDGGSPGVADYLTIVGNTSQKIGHRQSVKVRRLYSLLYIMRVCLCECVFV
jgi:hypothetical protein